MRNEIIIKKMIGYISKILHYCHGKSYAVFASDSMLIEACVFNLSQLGELCRITDPDFQKQHLSRLS